MPRRNPELAKRDEQFEKEAAAKRAASREALVPKSVTLNLEELEIPEGAALPPRMAQVVALRLVGLTAAQIAEKLCISPHTVNQHLYIARSKGRLADIGPILDHMAVPMAVENLINGLAEQDKEYTLEVLKGRGAFRAHSANVSSGSSGPMQLHIQVELPKGASGAVVDVIPGQVIGRPRE